MSDATSSRFEQADSSSQRQGALAFQQELNKGRDDDAEREQLERLYKKGENGPLTLAERAQFAALNSFPGIKEAQTLVIAEQTEKLSPEQSFELNAWRRFRSPQQGRERELFVKESKQTMTKEEEGEFFARTSFPGNPRAVQLFTKRNSDKTLTETEQQEVAALLKAKESAPELLTAKAPERRDFSPLFDSRALDFTDPYPSKLDKFNSKTSEFEGNQSGTPPYASNPISDNQSLLGPEFGPVSYENFSRAVPTEGSAIQGAGAAFAPGQSDYTAKLLEIYPNDPVVVRLFNQFLLGKIAIDSDEYKSLMNAIKNNAGGK